MTKNTSLHRFCIANNLDVPERPPTYDVNPCQGARPCRYHLS
jgi:hypothetical protein